MPGLTIGELAETAGVSVETIRFYERKGLVAAPPRKASGYREFPSDTVRRLRFIRRAKSLGFSLKEIQEILDLRNSPSVPCQEVRGQIEGKLEDVRRRVRDLHRMESALQDFHDLCESSDPQDECPILDLLEREDHE